MGLFDMFGAGGGRLAIQPQSAHVTAGGALAGTVSFQGGSRAQQITNITLKVVMDQTQMEMTQQGPRPRTHHRDLIPSHPIVGAFTSTPGQVQQFPFNLQIPTGVPNTTPNAVKYRIVVSADIDGEIDPGANVEIQIVGGAPAAAPGTMPGQMMPGQMMPGQMMPGQMMPGQMPMQPPMPPAPPQIGQQVMAQWQDGNWHAAQVVAMQNGMIGVDWVSPALGQSSWVQPHQVQAQQPQMMQPQMMQPQMNKGAVNDPYGKHAMHKDPHAMHKDPHAMHKDPHAMHKDPHAMHKDPHAMHKDPMHAKGAVYGAPIAIGTHVFGQWQDGNWHAGRVVAHQNGMLGVDWDDPKLGQSSWLAAHQVRTK